METNKLTTVPFLNNKSIRKTLFKKEWWFSVIDFIYVISDTQDPQDYWTKIKTQEKNKSGTDLSIFCHGLKLEAADGKKYLTDCATTEGIFRIIQSIPSPKAEPFKLWLAKVGKERLEEIENPELGMQRARALYEKKGYPQEWIEKRMRGIAIREQLTDEWQDRGAKSSNDFALLINEIMQGAFDMNVSKHKKIKGLQRENLRDHMTDLELIISMLGEATTTQITKERDSQGIPKLCDDAKIGGAIAGRARKDIEQQTGIKVVSKENFLPSTRKTKSKLIYPK